MIISTYYDPLLATIDDLIRKDNVWFTEKKVKMGLRRYTH
jgi:hypothetical protein